MGCNTIEATFHVDAGFLVRRLRLFENGVLASESEMASRLAS